MLNLVRSRGKSAALGAEWPGRTPPLGIDLLCSPGKLFPLSGPRFSQFSNRDRYYGFICFTDAEWEGVPIKEHLRQGHQAGFWGRRGVRSCSCLQGKHLPLGCRVGDVCRALVPRSLSVRTKERAEARCTACRTKPLPGLRAGSLVSTAAVSPLPSRAWLARTVLRDLIMGLEFPEMKGRGAGLPGPH